MEMCAVLSHHKEKLTELSHKDYLDTEFASFDYMYNKVGNRVSKVDRDGTNSYTYDDIYRLTDVTYPSTDTTEFDYDATGNRTEVRENSIPTTYVPNEINQYTSVGGTSLTYDNNGNLLSDGTNTYTYDYENRLTQAITPDYTVTFKYDAFGRRIEKVEDDGVNVVTIWYYYDGDQVIEETDEYDATLATYVYGTGIDEVVRMSRDMEDYYYHADGLGTITDISDSSGSLAERYRYRAFGAVSFYDDSDQSISGTGIGNPYVFTGRRYDGETGLYYYRARYYDPVLGRFLSQDPKGYVDGPNLYTYCGNNPINWGDPWGLFERKGGWPIKVPNLVWHYAEGQLKSKLQEKFGDSLSGFERDLAARIGADALDKDLGGKLQEPDPDDFEKLSPEEQKKIEEQQKEALNELVERVEKMIREGDLEEGESLEDAQKVLEKLKELIEEAEKAERGFAGLHPIEEGLKPIGGQKGKAGRKP